MKFLIDLIVAFLRKIREFFENLEAIIILGLATIGTITLTKPYLSAILLPAWINPATFVTLVSSLAILSLIKIMKIRMRLRKQS